MSYRNHDSGPFESLTILQAQRDEFKRRYIQSRKALEEIRNAYEAKDFERVEHLLFMHTAVRRGNTYSFSKG